MMDQIISTMEKQMKMQAISFANTYFSLFDGLVSGLENCLSEDVVLEWFGNVIKGRKNVSAFIKNRKINSRHIFLHIIPIDGISFEKKHLNWAKFCVSHQECQKEDNFVNRIDEIREFLFEQLYRYGSKITHELHEGTFNFEATVEEFKNSVDKIVMQGVNHRQTSTINPECDQEDEHVQVKYVEANGKIEFSKFRRLGKKRGCSFASTIKVWRRPCKLQIAYTISPDKLILESSCKTEEENTTVQSEEPNAKLPGLKENEMVDKTVPNTKDFDGFPQDINFFEDPNSFVKHLETETAMKNSNTSLNLHYVKNKLVFNRPSFNVDDGNNKDTKKSTFNYQIHLMIYQDPDKDKDTNVAAI